MGKRGGQRSLPKIKLPRDASSREVARHAVEQAAKEALLAAHLGDDSFHRTQVREPGFSGGRSKLPSSDMSSDSKSSTVSYERAVNRGSKRGLFEPNDIVGNRHGWTNASLDGSIELDPNTTATETKTSSFSGNNKKRRVIKWRIWKEKKRIKDMGKHLAAEISNEAWMCGVCAKSFSSFEAAKKHEDYHIQEVVTDLGWVVHTSSTFQQSKSDLGHNSFNVSSVVIPDAGTQQSAQAGRALFMSSLQSRPDTLRMSAPALTSRTGLQPFNTPTLQRRMRAQNRSYSDDLMSSTGSDFIPDEYGITAAIPRSSQSPDQMSPNFLDKKKQSNSLLNEHDALLVPHGMKDYVVLADEALVDVCGKAVPLILSKAEKEAELELEWLAKDKSYYDSMAERSLVRRRGGTYNKFRTEGESAMCRVQNKFVDAYQLVKEGNTKRGQAGMDHYNRKLKGDADTQRAIEYNKDTLYVNVIVKNSIQVVSHELERLAKERWEAAQAKKNEIDPRALRFQKFRAAAQGNLVKLAGMALASDFTPRRIAVQLSNDLYRLLTPRLKRRGVTIDAEIEYRVGPFFVLGVNVIRVDWTRLVKFTHREVAAAKSRWKKEQEEKDVDEENPEPRETGVVVSFVWICYTLTKLTKVEVMAQFLAWCYYLHWTIYTPICFILYHGFLGPTFRTFFLSTVSDEIFFYVEEKGMNMDIGVRDASNQAAFMLSALREIRADGRELKKKQQEGKDAGKGPALGPVLGPAIKEDKPTAPPKPDGFEIPENFEYVGLELELPVGFHRLRWAFLSPQSRFFPDAIFREAGRYENIEIGTWSKNNDIVGVPVLPEGVKEADIVGAEKASSYLMPKSVFVKANMCFETAYIDAYNEHCFCLRKKALNPDAPYGSTFVAWTKYVVVNTGSDSCKVTCSVEAEFPNGPPMISRQIKGGMRAGVSELFVKIGESISKYADEFP